MLVNIIYLGPQLITLVTCSAYSTPHRFDRRVHTLISIYLGDSALQSRLGMILCGTVELAVVRVPQDRARYRRVLRMMWCITSVANGVMRKRRLRQSIGRNHLCMTMASEQYGLRPRPYTTSGRSGIDVPTAANRYPKWQKAFVRRE